jgi:uncharacterized LabA/DUF88 family protein
MPTTTFGVRPDSRVEVIIDGAHLYNVSRNLGFDVDYESLRQLLCNEYDCRRISFMMKVVYDENGTIQQAPIAKLLDYLRFNGFKTVLGETQEWNDATTGRRIVRQNVDVALACAMMQAAKHVDEIIVFAGSDDLVTAIEECASDGARVTLVSSIRTTPVMVSTELRSAADWFVDLQDIKDKILRRVREPSFPANGRVIDTAVVVEDRRRENSIRDRMRMHPKNVGALA